MTEFEEKYVNKIICGDCLEVMKDWPDKCVDLVLTDPPYGKKYARGKNGWGVCENKPTFKDVSWDKRPTNRVFTDIQRLADEQIVFGGNYFTDILPPTNGWIFWDKIGITTNKSVFADGELAWTSLNRVIKKYTLRVMGFINDSKDIRQHPTQKPLELFFEIVRDYSNPNDLILDPFCGSGTTCVAAKMLGRRYIGIDISPEYCKIAEERLRAVDTGISVKEARAGQIPLFDNSLDKGAE